MMAFTKGATNVLQGSPQKNKKISEHISVYYNHGTNNTDANDDARCSHGQYQSMDLYSIDISTIEMHHIYYIETIRVETK